MSYAILNFVYGVDLREEFEDTVLYRNDIDIIEEEGIDSEGISQDFYEGGLIVGTYFGDVPALGNINMDQIYTPDPTELQIANDDYLEKLQLIQDHPKLSDEFKEKMKEFTPRFFISISYS